MNTELIPLKHIQQLYFQIKKMDSNVSHSIGFDLVIKGKVKTKIIKSSLSEIVKKFPILNYKFFLEKDGLHQKTLSENNHFSCNVFDCSNETLDLLKIKLINEMPLDINPELGQNIVARLYKLNETEHILSVTVSHLVADAQSMEILLNDFLAEFRAQCINEKQLDEPLTFLQPRPLIKQPSYEVINNIELSKIQKLKKLSHKKNLSLFSILMAGLTTVSGLKTDTIGVLFSNRTPETQNVLGCYVQAVPVYLYERQSVLEMAKGVRQQVAQVHASLQKKELLPDPPKLNVMFSMVKNPDTDLRGPECVCVEYLRRHHSKPECPLHIYAYQYQEKLEIVFNYDPDFWDKSTLENMSNQYIENLITVSDQKNFQSESHNNMEFRMPEVRFDHVGVAAWEMNIGLKRLQVSGKFDQVKKKVKDSSMNVELASFKTGVLQHIELVTPLNHKAPCVGFLERLGEGPYHCCWQTDSLEKILESLNQNAISYTVIERYGQSALFPETPILFLLVDGLGLVEFIEKEQLSDHTSEPLHLEIISNDLDNAAKLFHMLGCKPAHSAKAMWQDPGGLFIQVRTREGAEESFIHLMTSKSKKINMITEDSLPSLSDTWKRRVCI